MGRVVKWDNTEQLSFINQYTILYCVFQMSENVMILGVYLDKNNSQT